MKKIFLFGFSICLPFLLLNCSDKDDLTEEEKMKDSPLTAEQHKQYIENAGISFVQALGEFDNTPLPEAIDRFSEVVGDLDLKNESIKNFVDFIDGLNNFDFPEILKLFVFQSSLVNVSDFYYCYTYNDNEYNWTSTPLDGAMKFIFPSTREGTINNSTITLNFSDIGAFFEGNMLPKTIKIVWTIDNKEVLSGEFNVSTFQHGVPVTQKLQLNIMSSLFYLNYEFTQDDKGLNVYWQLMKSNKQLARIQISDNPKYSIVENQEYVNFVKAGYINVECMNIAIKGVFDLASILAEATKYNLDTPDPQMITNVANLFNKYSSVYAYYSDLKEKIAQMQFYYNQNQQSDGILLLFTDGSKIDLSTYFGSGFTKLFSLIELLDLFD